jgi:hypothetical protein
VSKLTPYWQSDCGRYVVYHGDCREVLPSLEDGAHDAVVTDPPYGVGIEYASFEDTEDNLVALIRDTWPVILAASPLVAMTCGNGNQHLYPPPSWTCAWFHTGGNVRTSFGFSCWQPVLVWGSDPYLRRGLGCRPDAVMLNIVSRRDQHDLEHGHPCSKPVPFMRWMVERFSLDDHVVLDPFMGSGTTGVACVRAGRKFVGVELDRGYCAIAVRRIREEANHLFASTPESEAT